MVRSMQTSPHAWMMVEVDLSRLVADRERIKAEFRQRENVDLSYLPFMIKPVVGALKQHPRMNSSWTDDGVILKRRINIGVAVDTVGSEGGAAGDQLGHRRDRGDTPGLGDPHEPVRVEVVAEQKRCVCVGGREQARRPVVHEVPLVDRLEAQGVAFLAERREHRLVLGVRPQRIAPERRLLGGVTRDRGPEVSRRG